jgi:hypothetical protein
MAEKLNNDTAIVTFENEKGRKVVVKFENNKETGRTAINFNIDDGNPEKHVGLYALLNNLFMEAVNENYEQT